MDEKFVGIKEFQAKLADSFPQKGEITIVTKRNIPTYKISHMGASSDTPQSFFASLSTKTCPDCGQEIKDETQTDSG